LTGSRYEIDTSSSGSLQERDPLGANTGTADPYAQDPQPDFLNIVEPTQPL